MKGLSTPDVKIVSYNSKVVPILAIKDFPEEGKELDVKTVSTTVY